MSPLLAQRLDLCSEVFDFDLDAIPTARCGFAPIRHGLSCPSSARLVQQEAKIASRQGSKARRRMNLDLEVEVLGVERDCRVDIVNYVTHAYYGHSCVSLVSIKVVRSADRENN